LVITRAEGIYLWDPEGRRYADFLSGYSSLSQGHCHPRILKALIDQAQKITLASRAFHSDALADYARFVTEVMSG